MTESVSSRNGLWFLLLSLLVIVLDQASKLWILANVPLYYDINILPIFDITYVRNYGAAFSFLSDAGGWQRWFFTGIAAVVSVLLTYWMYKTDWKEQRQLWSFGLILGGAIGNVADRLVHGYVVDFLHFYYQNWHFPAFNVADIAISCGAALLLLDGVLDMKKQKVVA
ncbi:signal peptidase II [Psychrosphaera ytuae]|uniref:Lipoprotein signal peptidase n=1 Tax=Psychrosphaera ytuae TaxID=2820710 RepID=A0A975DD62_9GAMM|nr:signal peptidase II [Psychrosphaera ytuae]QTH64743.1 signal peptidase II [Psychrosphaera ytuae]